MAGKLIVFEGIDGSGKSTQFRLICDRLNAEKSNFRCITFPRYQHESSALIRMYLNGAFGKDPDAVNAYAASSFFAVDRYASFVQDWREYYESGGLILTDRYTTSNAIHQGAKLNADERREFFKWLYSYEFDLMRLPKPDAVFYMSIDAELASSRLKSRQKKTKTNADIHEQNLAYLESCTQSGLQAAKQYGWHIIDCAGGKTADGTSRASKLERTQEDIHGEVFNLLMRYTRGCDVR